MIGLLVGIDLVLGGAALIGIALAASKEGGLLTTGQAPPTKT